MKLLRSILLALPLVAALGCSRPEVTLSDGQLIVGGEPYTVVGMNWSCYPVGTNWAYNFWNEPDSVVKAQLDYEMSLLEEMGVNTVRIYSGIPPRWISYIWEQYGIRTMVNCMQGRYGLNVRGVWEPHTDYSDPDVLDILCKEASAMANTYKGTPGLLCYLLGNENNYGLFWDGAETEDIPEPDSLSSLRARAMYSCLNESARSVKAVDPFLPIVLVNGDLLFLDLLESLCPDVDILGVNTYRGPSFTTLFDRADLECSKPLLITEFGSDAYNTLTSSEEEEGQSVIDLANWKEILSEAGSGRCLGGCTFQFSDEWWKNGQDVRLWEQDTAATWHNGGYNFDYVKGGDNMNEEWFGICAKQPATSSPRLYDLRPRKAYYELRNLFLQNND